MALFLALAEAVGKKLGFDKYAYHTAADGIFGFREPVQVGGLMVTHVSDGTCHGGRQMAKLASGDWIPFVADNELPSDSIEELGMEAFVPVVIS